MVQNLQITGEAMDYAKQALLYGLALLTENDLFNVVAFDHEQLWFNPMGVGAVAWGTAGEITAG